MSEWSFLTNHARALLCIAHDPGIRLRDIGATLGITERTAFGIVTDLTNAGYVVKTKEGNRNRYHIQHHLNRPGLLGDSWLWKPGGVDAHGTHSWQADDAAVFA
jgi:DNA-binding IclR family transcriptional regulator